MKLLNFNQNINVGDSIIVNEDCGLVHKRGEVGRVINKNLRVYDYKVLFEDESDEYFYEEEIDLV